MEEESKGLLLATQIPLAGCPEQSTPPSQHKLTDHHHHHQGRHPAPPAAQTPPQPRSTPPTTKQAKLSSNTIQPPPGQSSAPTRPSSPATTMPRTSQTPSQAHPQPSTPVTASFPSTHTTFGAGAAVFHLATARVVLCRHPASGVHFLPKGRRNASEPFTTAAVREAFEESGFRCRLLSLPLAHRQPVEGVVVSGRGGGAAGQGVAGGSGEYGWVVEPVWTQLVPVVRGVQYVLLWFVAETLDEGAEAEANVRALEAEGLMTGDGRVKEMGETRGFVLPRDWEEGMTVAERKALDGRGGGKVYEPTRHLGTGVDSDELTYEARLVDVEEAVALLKGTVMADVIKRGWEAIQLREQLEAADKKTSGTVSV